MKERGKKGQEITLGTIILIVLGIAVLVFLIFGFSTGWSNFWGRVNPFASGTNMEQVKLACDTACQQDNAQVYCVHKTNLKYTDINGKNQQISVTCDDIRNGDLNGIVKLDACSITSTDCQNEKAAVGRITTIPPAP